MTDEETVTVEYELEIEVSGDSPALTEEDIQNAILRYCTDLGLPIVSIRVARA